eukprot:1206754-Pyramimonas_sp.AAC.1
MAMCIYIAGKESKMVEPTPADQGMQRISEQVKQILDERLKAITIGEIGTLALYCRAKMQKKQEGEDQRATILLKFDHSHQLASVMAPLIFRTIEIEGGKELIGAAPRGPLEREISR